MATYKVYFAEAGVATTGLTVTWEYLKKVSDGTDEGSPPAFTEIGGGWYKYSYSPTEDMVGVIDGSATITSDSDRYVPVDFTASDTAITEITAERMGALTDWINGGRLDLLLDAIPTTPMRGTDGANTVTPPTLAELRTTLNEKLYKKTVDTRHANDKPATITVGSGDDEIDVTTTIDGSGNTETESYA